MANEPTREQEQQGMGTGTTQQGGDNVVTADPRFSDLRKTDGEIDQNAVRTLAKSYFADTPGQLPNPEELADLVAHDLDAALAVKRAANTIPLNNSRARERMMHRINTAYNQGVINRRAFEPPTIPEATIPEATAPEATIPEATAPEATIPEATIPEATAPEATDSILTPPPAYTLAKSYLPNNNNQLPDIEALAHLDPKTVNAVLEEFDLLVKNKGLGESTRVRNIRERIYQQTLKATAPEATAPEATAPEATAPETTAPKATAPETTTPEVNATQATATQATTAAKETNATPKATAPEATATTPKTTATPKPIVVSQQLGDVIKELKNTHVSLKDERFKVKALTTVADNREELQDPEVFKLLKDAVQKYPEKDQDSLLLATGRDDVSEALPGNRKLIARIALDIARVKQGILTARKEDGTIIPERITALKNSLSKSNYKPTEEYLRMIALSTMLRSDLDLTNQVFIGMGKDERTAIEDILGDSLDQNLSAIVEQINENPELLAKGPVVDAMLLKNERRSIILDMEEKGLTLEAAEAVIRRRKANERSTQQTAQQQQPTTAPKATITQAAIAYVDWLTRVADDRIRDRKSASQYVAALADFLSEKPQLSEMALGRMLGVNLALANQVLGEMGKNGRIPIGEIPNLHDILANNLPAIARQIKLNPALVEGPVGVAILENKELTTELITSLPFEIGKQVIDYQTKREQAQQQTAQQPAPQQPPKQTAQQQQPAPQQPPKQTAQQQQPAPQQLLTLIAQGPLDPKALNKILAQLPQQTLVNMLGSLIMQMQQQPAQQQQQAPPIPLLTDPKAKADDAHAPGNDSRGTDRSGFWPTGDTNTANHAFAHQMGGERLFSPSKPVNNHMTAARIVALDNRKLGFRNGLAKLASYVPLADFWGGRKLRASRREIHQEANQLLQKTNQYYAREMLDQLSPEVRASFVRAGEQDFLNGVVPPGTSPEIAAANLIRDDLDLAKREAARTGKPISMPGIPPHTMAEIDKLDKAQRAQLGDLHNAVTKQTDRLNTTGRRAVKAGFHGGLMLGGMLTGGALIPVAAAVTALHLGGKGVERYFSAANREARAERKVMKHERKVRKHERMAEQKRAEAAHLRLQADGGYNDMNGMQNSSSTNRPPLDFPDFDAHNIIKTDRTLATAGVPVR